jgi:energy-coupling factor transport system permease protein
LLATAIRQAERTALAMDGRAFAAFPQRTYFRRMRFASADWLYLAGMMLASAALIAGLAWAGLLGRLTWLQIL